MFQEFFFFRRAKKIEDKILRFSNKLDLSRLSASLRKGLPPLPDTRLIKSPALRQPLKQDRKLTVPTLLGIFQALAFEVGLTGQSQAERLQ